MATPLADKDTSWLARFVEDMIRNNAPAALANISADEVTVTTMLNIADQVLATQQALDYLNQAKDPWHFVGNTADPLAPTFQNTWVNWDANRPVKFRKGLDGHVELWGYVAGGGSSALNQAMFTLPVGYRPDGGGVGTNALRYSVVATEGFGSLGVRENGEVILLAGTLTWVSLYGVRWLAEK